MGEVCGLERMNHTLCVVLVLIAEQVDGVFQCMRRGLCLPPGGVDLLPRMRTWKGPME